MKQVVVIHGGDTFDTYEEYLDFLRKRKLEKEDLLKRSWKDSLAEKLPNHEVLEPQMPNKLNAKYLEWKIWFEKVTPFLQDGVVLVGHSLGGIFLAKYLSENDLQVEVAAVLLLAAPYDEGADYSLVDFKLVSLEKLRKLNVHLYHSEDDTVVPFENLQKYRKVLPDAKVKIFKDRNHFNQEEFPELIEDIKSL